MMILPSSPNRLWLLSFWLNISFLIGALIGALSWTLISPPRFGLAIGLFLVLALPALLRPQIVSALYIAWNKLAREFARCARLWLMGICFYIIFFVVGRSGSSLRLTSPGSGMSLWVPRATLEPTAYVSQYDATTGGSIQQGWISIFLSWAVRSGNLWACCLLPFFILLRAFETEEESSFPTNIYTLY